VSAETLGAADVTRARNAIPVMKQVLRVADMSPPQFEDGVSTFFATFPRHSLIEHQILSWLAGLGEWFC
jgi:hypothetical protein